MICVSIGNCNLEECLKMIRDIEFCEIRMDRMDVNLDGVKRIFSSHRNLIATFKKIDGNEERRKEFLIRAIEAGARYVDVEIDFPWHLKREIIDKAREMGCYSILSFHDYKETKDEDTLKDIVRRCFGEGADFAKIACKVNHDNDNLRLLNLISFEEFEGRLIVVGMGEKGKLTRILAPILGSPFTFASYKEGLEMAEGQIERRTLETILCLLKGKKR